jgi:hypothetical protein
MKKLAILFFAFSLGLVGCKSKDTVPDAPAKKLTNKDFGWTIIIPENFESVSGEDWAKIQNKGQVALEQTIDGKIDNQTKPIFIFRSDKMHYMASTYQPFDTAVDGDFLESVQMVNSILAETFVTQMPGTKIDTLSATEKIDELLFYTYSTNIHLPCNKMLSMKMYNRLFGKKEFTMTIMYVDEKKGKAMLTAWRNSKFGKI